MKTAERAEGLARAASHFPELHPPTARDLLECVRLELGHEEILDGFQLYGSHLSMAIAPEVILHILSGNTPHAPLQTLLRGLLLGSHNLVKLPACGLGAFERFFDWLPAPLAAKIETSRQLEGEWIPRANAWVVFGNDDTVAALRGQCPPGIPFQSHGHKLSLGVVLDDPELKSCPLAARDVSLFDQMGCLSPHVIYVRGDVGKYAAGLAQEMEKFQISHPAAPLSTAAMAEVAHCRADWEFRAVVAAGIKLWKGEGWTVVLEDSEEFPVSPLHRFVFVKPLPPGFPDCLGKIAAHFGGLGLWPATPGNAMRFAGAGFSRICAMGRMQETPMTWHADSRQNLASLVRWVDFHP